MGQRIKQIASFQYTKKFLTKGLDLSPIKMPVKNGDRIYSFPELRKQKDEERAAFKGLHGLLADSLPDRYGNQLINVWLAQNGRPQNSMNPVEQLCFIGTRGMGVFCNRKLTPHCSPILPPPIINKKLHNLINICFCQSPRLLRNGRSPEGRLEFLTNLGLLQFSFLLSMILF